MKEKLKGIASALGYAGLYFFVQFSVILVTIFAAMINLFSGMGRDELVMLLSQEQELNRMLTSMVDTIMLPTLIGINGILLAILWLIVKCRRQNFTQKISLKKTKASYLLIGSIIAIGMYSLNTGLVELLGRIDFFHGAYMELEAFSRNSVETSFWLSLFVVGLLAPFVEEVLFRGFIYQTLRKRLSIGWTIALQGLLFGLFHMNSVQIIYATFIGIVFGYIVYRTGSIWVTIVMHMVNNAGGIIMEECFGAYAQSMPVIIGVLGVGIVITGVGLYLINKNCAVNKKSFI